MKKYIFLFLLTGLVSVEINAASAIDAKDIFQKLNKRLKHGTFDNIKIDFKSTYKLEEDLESGEVELKERCMHTSLIRKGNLFRQNDIFFFDGNHESNHYMSSNEAFSAHYLEPTQYFKNREEVKDNNMDLVYLSQKEGYLKAKNYLFNAFHLRSEIGIDRSFTEFYLKDGDILVARSRDNSIREEIHLTDIKNALYNKIETYQKDKLIQTHLVKEWIKIDERYVPKKTVLMNDGEIIDIFELNSIEFDPDYTKENFTLKIPYSDELYIYNQDTHEMLRLSSMDKQLWENGDYLDAFYDAYYRKIEKVFLEPLEGVEDVTDQVVVAMPTEDKSKTAAGDLVIDDDTSKNDKEDIVREAGNDTEIPKLSKITHLLYVLGVLLLLGAIGFVLKMIMKSKK